MRMDRVEAGVARVRGSLDRSQKSTQSNGNVYDPAQRGPAKASEGLGEGDWRRAQDAGYWLPWASSCV